MPNNDTINKDLQNLLAKLPQFYFHEAAKLLTQTSTFIKLLSGDLTREEREYLHRSLLAIAATPHGSNKTTIAQAIQQATA